MKDNHKELWIVISIFAIGGIGYFMYDKYVKQSSTFQTISWFQKVKNNF